MKHQKGFAPIIIVAIVVVIGLVGGAGYMLTQQKSDNEGVVNKGKSLLGGLTFNPNCKLNDPDLCKYMNQAASADFLKAGFSGKSVTVDAKGQKSESLWEIAGEGRSHFTSSRKGKEESNVIMIDGATYMKDYTDNKWWKYPAAQSNEGKSSFSLDEIKKNMKIDTKEIEDKTKYEKIGTEACDNMNCVKYKVTTEFAGETTVQYMYIDTREYLLRKIKVDDKNGGSTETVFSYKPVIISIPSQIKEMNNGLGGTLNNFSGEIGDDVMKTDNQKIQEDLKKIMDRAPGQENNIPLPGEDSMETEE